MGNRIAPAGGTRISFALLALVLVAASLQIVSIEPAQALAGDTGPSPITGTDTSALSGRQWESKNQHRVWRNGSRWDAIIPTAATGWRISQGSATTVGANPVMGPVVLGAASDRPDVYWDGASNRLYVLMSGAGSTLHVFSYNGSTYVFQYSSTLPSMDPGEARAAIYKSPNGFLWASMMTDNGLFVTRSINDGVSWQGPVKLQNPVAEGQTQLAHFTVGATTQIGVAAAEDGDDTAISNYLFYRIDQTDANWATVVYAIRDPDPGYPPHRR